MTDNARMTLDVRNGRDASALLDEVLPAYEEVYAEPPYREGPREVADFRTRHVVAAGESQR